LRREGIRAARGAIDGFSFFWRLRFGFVAVSISVWDCSTVVVVEAVEVDTVTFCLWTRTVFVVVGLRFLRLFEVWGSGSGGWIADSESRSLREESEALDMRGSWKTTMSKDQPRLPGNSHLSPNHNFKFTHFSQLEKRVRAALLIK
jgi:hypothetical protein